jgi:hypothetical protein
MLMKFLKLYLLCISILAFGCIQRSEPRAYTTYTPILMAKASLAGSIRLQGPLPIGTPAKIYYKGGYIFISERLKGVHIIDNSNPTNPIKKGFIAIPGCLDMAIKNNTLYVDNAVDLVAISLLAMEQGKLQIDKRIPDVFPEPAPPDGGLIPEKFNQENRPKNTIIVDWK